MMDEFLQEESMPVGDEDIDKEVADDLGDALELTRNGRAKVTENNRGHA